MLSYFQRTVNILLYKQHTDYSKIYQSLIYIVLSLGKYCYIFYSIVSLLKRLLKCEGCTHFCEILILF